MDWFSLFLSLVFLCRCFFGPGSAMGSAAIAAQRRVALKIRNQPPQLSPDEGRASDNVGALIIRVGFGGIY